MEALNHPWFSDNAHKPIPLTMYERKLTDKTQESMSKALKLLLLNQHVTNFEESKTSNKENKTKEVTKNVKNLRVSSIKSKHSRLSSSQSYMNSTGFMPKKSHMARQTEELVNSICVPNRTALKKIN